VGDVLTAQVDPAPGKHWLAKKQYEREMEEVRKQQFPNLPSRLDCVFASFHPRSRFLGKGYLYAIKPIGRMHVTDSQPIDQIGRNSWQDNDYGYDSSLIEDYWKGVEHRRGSILDMEVLMDKAEVIEVLDEPKRLQRGSLLKFGSEAPTLKGEFGLNEMKPKDGSPPSEYAYAPDGIQLGQTTGTGWSKKMHVSIGPGFEGIICSYRGEEPQSYKKQGLIVLRAQRQFESG
jgi:hypothetical protein